MNDNKLCVCVALESPAIKTRGFIESKWYPFVLDDSFAGGRSAFSIISPKRVLESIRHTAMK